GDQNFFGTTNNLSPNQVINTLPIPGPVVLQRYPTAGVKVSIETLLNNASDADGDAISFVNVDTTSANGGTLTTSNGWIFYTPPAGFTNSDTFTYTISDGVGA